MGELIELFSIVPRDEGYHYLCRDSNGNHFEAAKAEPNHPDRMLFRHKENAQRYIDEHLDDSEYEVEFVFCNTDYLTGNIVEVI